MCQHACGAGRAAEGTCPWGMGQVEPILAGKKPGSRQNIGLYRPIPSSASSSLSHPPYLHPISPRKSLLKPDPTILTCHPAFPPPPLPSSPKTTVDSTRNRRKRFSCGRISVEWSFPLWWPHLHHRRTHFVHQLLTTSNLCIRKATMMGSWQSSSSFGITLRLPVYSLHLHLTDFPPSIPTSALVPPSRPTFPQNQLYDVISFLFSTRPKATEDQVTNSDPPRPPR
ncbi:hypothetical protein C8R42DRAFT_724396 [Lentinula raphanica]|nr:hypothetical protein C8R42DRAFT_724396 [Lentinula raphanica]